MTINKSLEQIKEFQDEVSVLKSIIRVQQRIIEKTQDIKVVKECYNDLILKCDSLDKFTQETN